MNPNPRIHRPNASSYVSSSGSVLTITESTALWKAMRHRQDLEREREEGITAGGIIQGLRKIIADLPFLRRF